jgi:hypothetical protein
MGGDAASCGALTAAADTPHALGGTPRLLLQACFPLFFPKACLCPALLLGANESLLQREEAAEICCFQRHSLCGPTMRTINSRHLHLGNEGVRTCTHVCIMQGACVW